MPLVNAAAATAADVVDAAAATAADVVDAATPGLDRAKRRSERIASSREDRLALPSRDGNQLEYTCGETRGAPW